MQPYLRDRGCSPLGKADEFTGDAATTAIGCLQYTSVMRGVLSVGCHRENLTSVSSYILSNLGPPGSSPM